MPRLLNVHLLPDLCPPESLAGATAVVIDILRASTTICHALAAGASKIIPCLTVEEAHRYQSQDETILLGGERGGVKIEGFDLDNSPLAYTREVVAGKTIAFTTTNGTKALHRCTQAEEILIGSFANLTAVVRQLATNSNPVHLVCAGTNDAITGEDVLFAGAVVSQLQNRVPEVILENDSARIALDFWNSNSKTEQRFRQTMLDSQGGRNLQRLGLTHDIERASERDLFEFVPVWNQSSNAIES
ncbi:MAG TPA: 2-phosphosulfolactate phosphatase [Planctomycetaceae bacterium]|nr:2-phosphosulfolactate phosphatase [Planctomycetaceae bacterium]